MVVADVAMDTNQTEKTPLLPAAERLRAAFVLSLGGLLTGLRRILVPYLLLSLGIFVLAVYALYKMLMLPVPVFGIFSTVLFVVFVVLYGLSALLYAGVLSVVSALRLAASYTEDFFYELLETLKAHLRERVDRWDEGIGKQQAKILLNNSVREVLSPLKQLRFRSVPTVLIVVLISVITFVSRSVFLGRLGRLTGATISWSALFASRATLVGALFLNMRWLATGVLWGLYGLGVGVILFNVWIIV